MPDPFGLDELPVPDPMAPDLSALAYPWDAPELDAPLIAVPPVPAEPLAAAPPVDPAMEMQPGLGLPVEALDAAVIPAPDAPAMPPPVTDELAGSLSADPADTEIIVPPAEPDAISGVGAPVMPGAAPAPPVDRQAYLNDLAVRDPAAFAEEMVRHEAEKQQSVAARRAELLTRDYDAQMANLKARQDANAATERKLQAVQEDSDRIAAMKIDPTGGISGLQRIAGVVGAILGGVLQGRTGSTRNMGLDALNATIEKGIELQRIGIVNQREALGHRNSALKEEIARHGDMFRAVEAIRLASLKHADDLLATEQQNYDPAGTTALRIAATRGAIAQQQAQSIAAFRQKDFENGLKLQDAARQQQIADETARRNRDQARHERADEWLRGREIEERGKDRRQVASDARAAREQAREDKRLERIREFSIGILPHVELDAKGQPVKGPDGKPVLKSGALTNADGELWLAASPEAQRLITKKTLAASEVSDMINEVLEIRDRVGGESGVFNSRDAQRLKVLESRLKMMSKSGTEGMSSDSDMAMIGAALGADDIASFRERSAGLKEGRDRTLIELNKAYRLANYTGPRIDFPNPYGAATKNTDEEDKFGSLLKAPPRDAIAPHSFAREFTEELRKRQAGMSPDEARAFGPPISADQVGDPGYDLDGRMKLNIPLTPAQRAVFDEMAPAFDADISAGQRTRIRELANVAAGSGSEADTARAKLQTIATEAQTAKLRAAASAELSALISQDALSATSEPEQTSIEVR